MIIGIDASRYGVKNKTGVEVYSDYIINNLIEIAKKENKHKIILYCKKDQNIEKKSKNVSVQIVNGKKLWTQLKLSSHLARNKPDVLFVPSHVLPIKGGKRNIITIHDVAFIRFPEVYSLKQRIYLKYSTKRACKKASKIIVPSESTKNDLIKYFNCKPQKIETVYHGIDCSNYPKINKSNNVSKFILFIGRLESKKNLIRLLKAFKGFKKNHQDWKIILAGPKGVGYDKIIETIKDLQLENSVETPGYVNDNEKAQLLANCRIFAFPSLIEGFGFPILEAYNYKVPVLTSDGSAMKEIGGKGALYINPLDTTSIQEGLEKLADNKQLISDITSKQKAILNKFTWEKTAQKTWDILTS